MTAGCTYRGSTSLTVHGKVTDFQMWRRELAEEELEQITGCRAFPSGDLVSWEGDSWFLNSSRGTVREGEHPQAREETADLESEVCADTSTSLHLVPVPSKVRPPTPRPSVAGPRGPPHLRPALRHGGKLLIQGEV